MALEPKPLKTFGRKSRPITDCVPVAAVENKLPPPAPASRAAAKGASSSSRLARQDLGIACSLMDDLQYAADGLKSSSVSVQRRSAEQVLALCVDSKISVARLAESAALVVSSLRQVRSQDALVSLAFAGVLRMIAVDEMCCDDVLQAHGRPTSVLSLGPVLPS